MSENKDYKINLQYDRDQREIEEPKNFDELKDKFIEEFEEEESKNYIFNYMEDEDELEINKDNFSEIMEKIKKSESKNIYVTEEKEEDPMRQTQNFSKQFNKSKDKEKEKEKDSELERINELKNSNLSGQEGISEFMMGKTLDERIRMTDNNLNEKKDEYENECGESKENENSNNDNNNFEIIKISSKEEPKELVNSIHMNDSKDLDKLNEKIKELNESQIKYKEENNNLLKALEAEKNEKKQLQDKVKSLKERIKKERAQKSQLESNKKDIETKYDKLNESLSKSKLGESSDNLQILKEKNDELTSDYRNLESENLHLKKEIEKNKNNQDINDTEFNLLKDENTQLKKKIINLENDLTKKNKILYNKNIRSEKPETIFDEEEKAKILERKNKKIKKLTLINQMIKNSTIKSNKQNKNQIINKGKHIEDENKTKIKNIEQSKLKLKLINEKRKTIIIKKKEEEQKKQKMEADKNEEIKKNQKHLEEKNNELNTELKKRNEQIDNLKNRLTKIEESKDTKNKLLADIDKERDEYKNKIKDLELQLSDKSKKLDENKTKLELMTKNSNEFNLKMKSYEDKTQNDKKNIDELNQKINSLLQENKKQKLELKEYQEQIENYKSDLSQSKLIQLNQKNQMEEFEIKKKEYHNALEAKYEKLYQERIKDATNSINESIENHKISLQKKYEEQIKSLENNYNKKFNEMSQSILQNQNKSNLKKCQTKHEGIKCNVCFKSPIIGYRYKCISCNNFNLCEECEEANEQSNAHPHLFVKMAKFIQNLNKIPLNNNDNFINEKFKKKKIDDDDDFNIIKFGNKDEYSLEIINKHNLNPSITEGEDNIKIELIIKNNGSKQWPENGARLVFNDNKNLTAKPIYLRPQKPEEQQNYELNMEDLHVYPAGKYEAEMNFEIDGKQYGDEIDINVTINEKQKDPGDDEENAIQKFRDTYGLDSQDYSNEVLLDKLKKFNFDFPKAFSSLFED